MSTFFQGKTAADAIDVDNLPAAPALLYGANGERRRLVQIYWL